MGEWPVSGMITEAPSWQRERQRVSERTSTHNTTDFRSTTFEPAPCRARSRNHLIVAVEEQLLDWNAQAAFADGGRFRQLVIAIDRYPS